MKPRRERAVTLIEVTVASVIMALVLVGVAQLYVLARKYFLHSTARSAGSELGKLFLEPLHAEVRQDTWDDSTQNNLAVTGAFRYCDGGASANQMLNCPDRTVGPVTYTANYTIEAFDTDLRKVRLDLTWSENAP